MRALIVGALLLLVVLTGTAIIAVMRPAADSGTGSPAFRETRNVAPFKRVSSNGSIQLVIDAKPGAPRISLAGPRASVALVKTVVDGETLTISQTGAVQRVTAYIAAPGLAGVTSAGGADVKVSNLASAEFRLDVSGTGDTELSGKTGALTISIAGTGDVDASDLDARDASVTISGTGDAKVRATSSLTAEVNGTGDLTYYGNPAHVTRSVNGMGSVKPG